MSLLFAMKGKAIKEIDTANDYLSIGFDDGSSGINIFNDYTTDVSHLSELIGKVVQDISEGGDHWKLIFSDGTYLQIGMRDCDYNGPESSIYFAGGNFYVNQ